MGDVLTGRAVMYPKERVEKCNVLDIAQFKRDGHLKELAANMSQRLKKLGVRRGPFPETVQASCPLKYRSVSQGWEMSDTFSITSTPCFYGGDRFWFICPGCGKRARVLYCPPSSRLYRCRSCHDLTYAVRQEHRQKLERLLLHLDRIRRAQEFIDRLHFGQKGLSKLQARQILRAATKCPSRGWKPLVHDAFDKLFSKGEYANFKTNERMLELELARINRLLEAGKI
ncbi:MAG: hypothetical protein M0Z59_07420 [Nitrospiraceae bacterium]|nr:hypothetical protein [Nitrospiraceae bacterium]